MQRAAYILLQIEAVRVLEDLRAAMKDDSLSNDDAAYVTRMLIEVRRFLAVGIETPVPAGVEPSAERGDFPGVDIDAVHLNPRWAP